VEIEPEAIEAFYFTDTFVPPSLRDGLIAYIEIGRSTGSFLTAVLCNNLQQAVFRADPATLPHLPTVVRWLWNFAPAQCHGSENHHRGWMDARQRDLEIEKENAA